MALLARLLLFSVLLGLPAHGQKLADILDVDCTGDGSSEEKKLVGPLYLAAAKEKGDPFWSTYVLANDSANAILVKNGCPAHYGMHHDETVHFKVVRENGDSSMLAKWEQTRWYTVPKFSWETERIPHESNFAYYLWYQRLHGEVTWHPSNWYWFFTYAGQQHVGDGDAMVVDLTAHLEGSTPSVYEGKWYFTFHQQGSHMTVDDYNVLKKLYTDTCAPHRNGTLADHPWESHWSMSYHMLTDDYNYDTMPYCEWMKRTGWNETYITQDNYAYACDRIEDVVCDADGHVTHMYVNQVGLKGQMPAEIGNLMHLVFFEVDYNQLSGTVPDVFKGHDKLKGLSMRHNLLEGTLPCFDGDAELSEIDLGRNKFTGSLWSGSCITTAVHLQHIWVDNNDLGGSLPDWSTMKLLAWLQLQGNHFEGSIPETLCHNTAMFRLMMDTNQFVGSFPHACLNPTEDGSVGWERLYYLGVEHNRMTGSLPVFGPKMLNLKRVFLDYNYFEGLVDHQFDVIVEHAAQSALTEVSVRGNYLSGPFPEVVYRMLTETNALTYLYVDDNLFRCENNGQFPPWSVRSYARGNAGSWFTSHTMAHGMCKPVPNPTEVTPSTGEVGQVVQVRGHDILLDAKGKCKFMLTGGSTVAYSRAKVKHTIGSQPYMECAVPTSLSDENERSFTVTISNYGDDFSSSAYWSGSSTTYNPPSFTITPVKAMESGVVVNTEFNLVGVSASDFNEADFRQMIADISGVPVGDVHISLTPPDSRRLRTLTARKLQTNLPVYVSISVPVSDPNSDEAKALVTEIQTKLENQQNVEEVMERYNFEVESTALEVHDTAVEPEVQTLTQHSTKKEDSAMLGIIIAAACGALVCCLCGFVGFIRYREKKGQPYFKETLDDGGAGGGNTGASYGNAV